MCRRGHYDHAIVGHKEHLNLIQLFEGNVNMHHAAQDKAARPADFAIYSDAMFSLFVEEIVTGTLNVLTCYMFTI